MAKDDYRFPDAKAYLAWVQSRPRGEEWRYVDGYAVMLDGLWDGEHWRAPPRGNLLVRLRRRISETIIARRRPDFSTPEKFLDWSERKRDDP